MGKDDLDIVGQLEALRRYARVLTRNADTADDLVQSTFLRAHERRATFRDGANVRVWLMSIMHNIFIDERRNGLTTAKRERAWTDSLPGFSAPSGEMAVRLSELRKAFLSLNSEQREALHLVAVEGLGVTEAAEILHVPSGTVMSRVGRARAALRNFEESGSGDVKRRSFRIVGERDGHTDR
ncbi:sigma-70 family RNA polymerase sigma factor [Nisaea denitrificans]|uniref:sigma-70 family RNA polymerase sigma factor n=1 Tax=Nisaea denitrificans TaxID=390877 RepID=UPI00041C6ADB|nr:sigma-70 family RNA polymerase sigma factor [Nisaea denitrificans]